MRDRRLRELFEREIEIPDVVQEKVYEVYRQVGADMQKVEKVSNRNQQRKTGMRYLKAASFLLFALMAATTVHAAANGGFEKLSRLFSGDVSKIQSSSATPEISSEKSTFKDLKVSVQQVLGTEELTYIVLNVKRTDGKTFDKDMDYAFGLVGMKGENDMDIECGHVDMEGEDDTDQAEHESAHGGISSFLVMKEGKNGSEIESSEQRYTDSGIMMENNGTDEITLAVVCGYEQFIDGVSSYHKGEKCQLELRNLFGNADGKEEECIRGMMETEFVLDYGDCQKKVCEPGKNIKMPKDNSETEYLPVGKLDRVTITPYSIKYERTVTEKQSDNEGDTWDQIYLEMEDGTQIGYPTLKSSLDPQNRMGGYGTGTDWKYTNYLLFSELIDVEHVKAIYFGKTRIDI